MDFRNVYFLGIGGIGMSALARYFMHEGKRVGGYDRTETQLTRNLEKEGAEIHYEDDAKLIGGDFLDPSSTLVVYTPAIPSTLSELEYLRGMGFRMVKRSEILGYLAEGKYVMAVAGTHGKTTTTTLTAWLNYVAGDDCGEAAGETNADDVRNTGSVLENTGADIVPNGCGSAFLGGISKNFDSNLVLGRGRRLAVEADEYDRSFLKLYPDVAVVTSADPDHLDIYGSHENLKEAFGQFVRQIREGGTLIIKQNTDIPLNNPGITVYRYSCDRVADFYARNISLKSDGTYWFDIVCPDRVIEKCTLGVPGYVNIENAVAAAAMIWVAGFDEAKLKWALANFKGVKRRFDFYINTPGLVYMDDYAHHPEELRAALGSVRAMFPGRTVTAVFQPHLYTRTSDFYREFAGALSLADEVILLPVYPAREEPIEGVDSELIASLVTVPHRTVELERIAQEIGRSEVDVLVSFGAGTIENYCGEIARVMMDKADK